MADNEVKDDTESPDIVQMAHKYYRASRDHMSKWREEARVAYDMVAGNQWDEADVQKLEEQQRPAVVFNRIARTVNAIIGTQVSNRQETRFIPRELGDAAPNEILTSAAEWARDNCNAEDEESDAFEDMCTCGYGWTDTRMDYTQDIEGKIVIERIDPFEMYYDPKARKRNLSDARWVLHIKDFDPDEFERLWPDAQYDSANDPWEGKPDDLQGRHHVYPQDAYEEQQSRTTNSKQKRVRVGRLQYSEMQPVYRVGPQAEELSAEEFQKFKKKIKDAGIPYIVQEKLIWKQAFIACGEVLEEGPCPYQDGPTFRSMTYKRDRNSNTFFGIVRAMVDPQKFGNKFFSQILDILNKGAKGGVFIEAGAVEDVGKLEAVWARPDPIIKLHPGGLTKVKQRDTVQFPAGLDRLMSFSMDSVHEVTGVNLELLGMANRDQPGVLEHQRKQAGVTIIAPLFDGMRRYRKEQGMVLLYFIQKYLSDGRLIRITGKSGDNKYIPLAKQEGAAEYDVIVDEAPTSPNMKERVFGILQEMMPTLAKMGIPLPPELLDYAPLPSVLAQKWKELIASSPGNPEQIKQQMDGMQKQLQKLTQENTQLKDKKAEFSQEMELERAKFMAEMQNEREKMQLEREKVVAEIQLEREKAAAQIAIEREKASAQTNLDRERASVETELKHHQTASQFVEEALKQAGEMEFAFDGGNRTVKMKRGDDGKISIANMEVKPSKRTLRINRGATGDIEGASDDASGRNIVVQRDPATGDIIGATVN